MRLNWQVFGIVLSVVAALAIAQTTQPAGEKPAGAEEDAFDYTACPSDPAEVAKLLREKAFPVKLAACKVTLAQAQKAAEAHTGGKAAAVNIKQDKGELVIEVEIWKNNKRTEIQIDPATGQVAESKETANLYFPGEAVAGLPTKTDSGLMYYDLKAGDGDVPDDPQGVVEMHYSGWLLDGKLWQSSQQFDRPLKITMVQLPAGWSEALKTMKVGGQRKLIVPSALGFGRKKLRNAPPNATMIVDIELISALKNKPVTGEDLAAARKLGEAVEGEPVKTESGLYYWEVKVGEGKKPQGKQARVKIEYTGYLADGTVFDTSKGKPAKPPSPLGRIVTGIKEGVSSMSVGGKRKLVIPSELGYQLRDQGKIPAGSTIIFDVELLEVLPPATRPPGRGGLRTPRTRPAGRAR